MAIPATGSIFPLTCTGHAIAALRPDQADRPAAEVPVLASGCDLCTARSLCLITPWLAADSLSPDPASLANQVFAKGEHIFKEGDVLARLYAVQSGTIKSCIMDHTGNERVVSFRMRGDLLGLDDLAGGVH